MNTIFCNDVANVINDYLNLYSYIELLEKRETVVEYKFEIASSYPANFPNILRWSSKISKWNNVFDCHTLQDYGPQCGYKSTIYYSSFMGVIGWNPCVGCKEFFYSEKGICNKCNRNQTI